MGTTELRYDPNFGIGPTPDALAHSLGTNDVVTLFWKGNKRAYVQRSEDGLKFYDLAEVPNGVSEYVVQDSGPLMPNYYYRIKEYISENKSNVIFVEPTFDVGTTILCNRMVVQPSIEVKKLIDVTIRGLKSDGVFYLADCIYFRGLHTEQASLLNWRKAEHDSQIVLINGNVSHINGYGFHFYGSAHIANNYSLYYESKNVNIGDLTFALYSHLYGGGGSATTIMGTVDTFGSFYLRRSATVSSYAVLLSGQYDDYNIYDEDFAAYTKDGLLYKFYRNGSFVAQKSIGNLTSKPKICVYEGCCNGVSGPYEYSGGHLRFTWYSAKMSVTQHTALYNRIKYFYDTLIGSLITYGPNLVVNGTFDDPSGWTYGGTWSISGGKANYLDVNNQYCTRSITLYGGRSYRIYFDISNIVGTGYFTLTDSGTNKFLPSIGTYYSVSKTYIYYVKCLSNMTTISLFGNTVAGAFSIDNLVIEEMMLS